MRTHSFHPHHPGTLRHGVLSVVLVCAGWFAGVSGAVAQDVAGQGADAVQASLGGDSAAVLNPSATASVVSATTTVTDASTSLATSSDSADQALASNDDSVGVAENTASKKVFVTGSAVTRYDVASLDDRVLGNQHGRAVGMLMVAAVPDSFRSNAVTLWDEIAPPTTQTPQPVGAAAGAAQSGNIVNYTRK